MKRKPSKLLMFLGTGSDVGKSVLAAAFCRIFKQDGFRVAPFKAQNMALNSFITPEGGEMGRAQVVQAEAAGIEPHVDMNPVLLKPTSTMGSQVIVLGKAVGNFSAKEYYRYKKDLFPVVLEAFHRLAARYEIIVLEGAGSAVELNLKAHDLVNLSMAKAVQAPSVLVGDIDRGGIFAALIGSLVLMEPEERNLIAGLMVNKLRGDPDLFRSGVHILEERSERPVLGVIPYFDHIAVPEEDSVALGRRMARSFADGDSDRIRIGVVRLPFVSNYTDFDCFEHEPGVDLIYFDHPGDVFRMDAVILPGSKNTIEDMAHLERTGMADAVRAYAKCGEGIVVGICGGYQMLGKRIVDPTGGESRIREIHGLGLLEMVTEMASDKITTQVTVFPTEANPLWPGGTEPLMGYEIHMGRSRAVGEKEVPCFRIHSRNGRSVGSPRATDGLTRPDGRVWGTYIHGIFDNDSFRRRFLARLSSRKGRSDLQGSDRDLFSYARWKEEQYDLLADHVRRHCDMERIYRIIGM